MLANVEVAARIYKADALFFRRRHQLRRPTLAKIRPGKVRHPFLRANPISSRHALMMRRHPRVAEMEIAHSNTAIFWTT